MRVTIQLGFAATEFGTNIVHSDDLTLVPKSTRNDECSYQTLQKLYDIGMMWHKATHLMLPINGKLWSFNPAHIARMCVVLNKPEEDAFERWAEGQNARQR